MFQKRMIVTSVIIKYIPKTLLGSILAHLQIICRIVQCESYKPVHWIWNLLIQ